VAVETLTSVPSLPRLYLRAALTARGRRGTGVPDTVLGLEGLQVDRDRLLRYQRLCGFAVGDVLPHTYPHLLGFPLQMELMARPGFPLALPGLVHLENEVTVHRTLTAADRLDVTVHAAGLRSHAKGALVDLVTEAHAAGDLVWRGRSTYLRRGTPSQQDAVPTSPPPHLPPGPPAATWRLPESLGRRYAADSGDVNPIHLHRLAARAMGFPQAIAHGMWTYARTLGFLGPRTSAPSTSRVWFEKPVLLPSTIECLVDDTGTQAVAGLRSRGERPARHLVLTWAGAAG
jgi:acyl dehydratase